MQNTDKPLIAIVDDELNIRTTISYALEKEGYATVPFEDGFDAWESFQKALPDLIILDILMPRLDGLQLCRKIREITDHTPIIFLSSKDEEFDRVLGLEIGADDYLCKPFSMRELVTRIKVLFRRIGSTANSESKENGETVEAGSLVLDIPCHTVLLDGAKVPATVTEFRILHTLLSYPGRVRTREELVESCFPYDSYVNPRVIDSHMKRLRKKLLEAASDFDGIETVHGLGYRYKA